MNNYQKTAKNFQQKIESDIKEIYLKYSNKLTLNLGEENLLESKDNCIESSTAIGYCMEEFVTKKLLEIKNSIYKRSQSSTINSSYDLYAKVNGVKILVNFKVYKKSNNAIAALKQLYKDYIFGTEEKLFLVFKTGYSIKNQKIEIKDSDSFYLEQFNFKNIKSDNRSWSKNNDNLSGRIQYNHKVRGLKNFEEISYDKTIESLKNLVKIRKSNA